MIVAAEQIGEISDLDVRVQRCFGAEARDLHDLYWASRRICVIRRGVGRDVPQGPSLYLLVEPNDLVLFDPKPALTRLRRARATIVRLRLRSSSPARSFRERVHVNRDGTLDAIRREYADRSIALARAWLTPDTGSARAWAQPQSRSAALSKIRQRAPKAATASLAIDASFSQHDRGSNDETMRELVRTWHRVGSVFPDVYELRHGVWIHRTASIDPDARVVPPVWIGANAAISSDSPVVGPAIVADGGGAEPPDTEAIDWGALRAPSWRLSGTAGQRMIRRTSKRVFDIVFSLCVLAVTLPFYPLIILAIALEDGWPPFFAHKRQSMKGKPFGCLKFRTMCKNADKIKSEILPSNEVTGPQFYVKNDPRVLRVGSILRRCQIDEFPQFFNVLLGHMSVVGPRPSPDNENQYCPAWREMRLGLRPGVTGLWQVKRTREPETDFQEWIRYDLEYVQHQSWRMDIWIIIQTIKRVIGG